MYVEKSNEPKNVYSDYYSSSSSLSMFDSDADRKSYNQISSSVPLSTAKFACMSISERGVPEGQEDPTRMMRPKIEIELDDNEAQEAYVVEKVYGNIVEDPPVKLEMPANPNNNNKTQVKHLVSIFK